MKTLISLVLATVALTTVARGEVQVVRIGPAPVVQAEASEFPNYPTSTGNPNTHSRRWTGLSGWQHLNSGQHRGKFDVAWLQTLTWAELQSLHDDDHEGRVKWEHAVRGNAKASPQASGGCPGGVCPVGVGLFSRFIRRG